MAVIEVELVKDTLSAALIAPLVLIASTIGTETKFVPAITTAVEVFSITEGVNEVIVGFVSVTSIVPDPPNATV